jgi:plasmid maintenance system antidote protein VapI
MTPARLATIGEALFGPQWQRPLARALGCSDRQVRYLAAGERTITQEVADQLGAIIKVRGEALARLGRQLEGGRGK